MATDDDNTATTLVPSLDIAKEEEVNTTNPTTGVAGDNDDDDDDDYLPPQSFLQLSRLYTTNPQLIANKRTSFYGWIRRIRVGGGGSIVFIDMYDGTQVGSLNCLCEESNYLPLQLQLHNDNDVDVDDGNVPNNNYTTLTYEQLTSTECMSIGASLVLDGTLHLSPTNATQEFEFHVSRVRVIGQVYDPITYPLQKGTEKKMVSLRALPFYRMRSQACQCLFRIRSKLDMAVHIFMNDEDVILTDPNILTVSDCEGAGETFTVSPLMFSTHSASGEPLPVSLTVSSQLPLEATIHGFRQVYTCQKSFRAEKSDTNKHLAEFVHVEYEGAFHTLTTLMDQAERFVKYVIQYVLEKCENDFTFLESHFAPTDMKPTRTLLKECCGQPFIRIKHRDAIALIRQLVKDKVKLPDENGKLIRVKVKELPGYEDDLGSEHEKILVQYFGYMSLSPNEEEREKIFLQGSSGGKGKGVMEVGAFVFVTHWPLKIKSFYMAQTDDGSGECLSFDLLCPRVGELFGGSMREWRYTHLKNEIERRQMDISPIEWFLELRKMGSCPHGGWGMGFDRLCMLVCGVSSVRDVVPFPVYYGHCPY